MFENTWILKILKPYHFKITKLYIHFNDDYETYRWNNYKSELYVENHLKITSSKKNQQEKK